MLDPGEFNPALYWIHVALGFGSALFAIVALAARKGSALHRRAGQIFAVTMGIAAVTAIVNLGNGIAPPPAIISALAAIYGIGMAILSLAERSGVWRIVQRALIALPIVIGLLYLAFGVISIIVPEVPLYQLILAPMAASLFLVMGWKDIRFLR